MAHWPSWQREDSSDHWQASRHGARRHHAACFENALFHVNREARRHFADGDIDVVAEIGLSRNDSDGFVPRLP